MNSTPEHRPTHIGKKLPRLTLAYQIRDWCSRYLVQPDGANIGKPWRFTDEQFRFLRCWFGVDGTGKFKYRRGVLRRMKGWGKDPLGAVLCLVELCGPCVFDHFTSDGIPVAVPNRAAWVQIAAVSKEQTSSTTSLFSGLISPKMKETYHLEVGKTMIHLHSSGLIRRIHAVTSAPRTLEGARGTFYLKNETHHWLQNNEGLEMSNVIARNAAKTGGRVLAITNAHSVNEISDALLDYETRDQKDVLYDSLEAADSVTLDDIESLRAGLPVGGSWWLDKERLINEIRDPRTDSHDARRFYLNIISESEEHAHAFDMEKWSATKLERKVEAGARIALGFDGSRTNDWTALIGTEIATCHQWVLGIWKPVYSRYTKEWSVDLVAVNAAIEEAFDEYDVHFLVADPYWWSEYVAIWAGKYNKPGKERVVSYSTTLYRKVAFAVANYREAINNGELTHDGNKDFSYGIRNSRKRMHTFTDDKGNPMFVIEKERPDSELKIDPAMAGVLSWEGRTMAIEHGALKPKRSISLYDPSDNDT